MPENQYVIDAITIKDTWRLFKILAELVDGFEKLTDIYPCVSIFGSARVRPGDETYEKTVQIARKLAESGFANWRKAASISSPVGVPGLWRRATRAPSWEGPNPSA